MQLYEGWMSSASWRVRWALALKGVAHESVWLDIAHDAVGYETESAFTKVFRRHSARPRAPTDAAPARSGRADISELA